jgi:hypothetical protein
LRGQKGVDAPFNPSFGFSGRSPHLSSFSATNPELRRSEESCQVLDDIIPA